MGPKKKQSAPKRRSARPPKSSEPTQQRTQPIIESIPSSPPSSASSSSLPTVPVLLRIPPLRLFSQPPPPSAQRPPSPLARPSTQLGFEHIDTVITQEKEAEEEEEWHDFKYKVSELASVGRSGVFHSREIGEFRRGCFTSATHEESMIQRINERYPKGWDRDTIIAYPGGKTKALPRTIEDWDLDWPAVESALAEGLAAGRFKKRTPFVDIYWKVKEKPKPLLQREATLERTHRQQSALQGIEAIDLSASQPHSTIVNPSTASQPRSTTTSNRLLVAEETQSIMENHGNHVPALAQKWTCFEASCVNEDQQCYIWKGNHHKITTLMFAKWSAAIDSQQVTVQCPPPDILIELLNSPVLNGRKPAHKRKSEEATPSANIVNITTSPPQLDHQQPLLQILQYLLNQSRDRISPPPLPSLPSRPSPRRTGSKRRRRQSPTPSPPHDYSSPITSHDSSEDLARDEFFDWCRDVAYASIPSRLPKVDQIQQLADKHSWKVDNLRDLSDPQSSRYALAIKRGLAEGILSELNEKISEWHGLRREEKKKRKLNQLPPAACSQIVEDEEVG